MDRHYQDRALVKVYDAVNASRADFDFYLGRFPKPPARVLDIGCGTGTFAIDLSRRGYQVTGVDPAPEMIAAAGRKTGADGVTWVVGLASDLPQGIRFDTAVMTGHAFQCLLQDADIDALFGSVARQLRGGGSFWFETRNPDNRPWRKWTPEQAGPPVRLPDGGRVRVVHNVLNVAGAFVTFQETYSFDDGAPPITHQSTLRFLRPEQITALAERQGLRVADIFGDWGGGALTPSSPEIIFRLENSLPRAPVG